jgi:uncharacterized protein
MTESLADKLKSLGVQLGSRNLKSKPTKGFPIEGVIEGDFLDTIFGPTFFVQHNYSSLFTHGKVQVNAAELDYEKLGQWGKLRFPRELSANKLLFLDTETSGLAGGTGTFVFLVGLGYFNENGYQFTQVFLKDPSEEPAFLTALEQIIEPFDTLVTFNGKSFDVPILNTRFTLNSLLSPLKRFEHIDLLPFARRIWRSRLPSRTLGNLEIEILGFQRTGEDIPGWMVPEIYYEYLRKQDARPLAGVFYHNEVDVLSLTALFGYACNLMNSPSFIQEIHSLDIAALAQVYEELGFIENAADLYLLSLTKGLPDQAVTPTLLRYALLFRRNGQMDKAVSLWKSAAERLSIEACEELAKFYEHQVRDPMTALEWTEKALNNLSISSLSLQDMRYRKESLNHRKNRLAQKVGLNDNR